MEDKIIYGLIGDLVKEYSHLEDLKLLLDSVSDTYPDFVLGMCLECKNEDNCKKMVKYLELNSGATSVDVINYMFDEVVPLT